MAYLGRQGVTAPLTSADIPDNSITSAKIVAGTIEASDVAADMATQAELDLKAPLASPPFTGTPTGITAAHITSGILPVGVTGGSGLTALGTIATADLTSYILKAQFTYSSDTGYGDEEQVIMSVAGDTSSFVPDGSSAQYIKFITTGIYFINLSFTCYLTTGDEENMRCRIWKTPGASVTSRVILAVSNDQVTTPEAGTAFGNANVSWVGTLTANEHIYFAVDSGADSNVLVSASTHATIIGFPS